MDTPSRVPLPPIQREVYKESEYIFSSKPQEEATEEKGKGNLVPSRSVSPSRCVCTTLLLGYWDAQHLRRGKWMEGGGRLLGEKRWAAAVGKGIEGDALPNRVIVPSLGPRKRFPHGRFGRYFARGWMTLLRAAGRVIYPRSGGEIPFGECAGKNTDAIPWWLTKLNAFRKKRKLTSIKQN